MPVATPWPAATVIVLRDAIDREGFDVLMVRRHDKVGFMAGAYVFPGGRVDDQDVAQARATPSSGREPSRFSDLTVAGELAHRIAAVRELEEEAGVTVDAMDLVPIAHWVTPEIETRRYDTRFFLAVMPAGQQARHDESEITELSWLTPQEGIERSRRGDIMLPPPTFTTLTRLARFSWIDDVLAWARGTPIPRVEPGVLRDEHRTMLTLPGDPTYPTIDGWEVPQHTRFLLRDGRWQPVRA